MHIVVSEHKWLHSLNHIFLLHLSQALQINNNLTFFRPLSNIRCLLFWVPIFKRIPTDYTRPWLLYYFGNYLFFCSQFFCVLPTCRIKFKCLLMFYEDLILPLAAFLTSVPPTFSPADFAPATLASFLLWYTFPYSVFCACCVSASGSAPQIFVRLVSSFYSGFCSCTASLWRLFCAE